MTRDLVLVAWTLVALAAVLAEALAFVDDRRFAHLDQVLAVLTRSVVGRVLFLVGWMWVGWHFFAR